MNNALRVPFVVLGLALFQAAPVLLGKCPFEPVILTVSVCEQGSGRPLSGASVFVFANDDVEAWPRDYVVPAPLMTDAHGVAAGKHYFHTATGKASKGRDDCSRVLSRVVVVVSRDGYVPVRLELRESAARGVSSPLGRTLSLPTIQLRAIEQAGASAPAA